MYLLFAIITKKERDGTHPVMYKVANLKEMLNGLEDIDQRTIRKLISRD